LGQVADWRDPTPPRRRDGIGRLIMAGEDEVAAGPWQGTAATGEDGRNRSAISPEPLANWRCETAFHEAGHAVAIWWHDRRRKVDDIWHLETVVIRRDPDEPYTLNNVVRDDASGSCLARPLLWLDPSLSSSLARSHRRYIVRARVAELAMLYAGPIAGGLVSGDSWDDELDWHTSAWDSYELPPEENSDLERIECLIDKMGQRWRAHFTRAWWRATHIVQAHQPHIKSLADVLIERDRIDGEEVFETFDRAGPAQGCSQ
jgi:hypothetical protein